MTSNHKAEKLREAILNVLRDSGFALTPSELRTRLIVRGYREPEYKLTSLLRVLRSEDLVSLDRRRWAATSGSAPPLPSLDPTGSVNNPSSPGEPVKIPGLSNGWSPSSSRFLNTADHVGDRPKPTLTNITDLSGPWASFRRLLGYYIDCVRKDGGCTATENLGDGAGGFASIAAVGPWYPLPGKRWTYTLPANERLQGLFRRLHSSGEAGALVLGYPIWIYEGPDNSSFMRPIFTYQLDFEIVTQGLRTWTEDPSPDVNADWLQYALKNPGEQSAFLTLCGLKARRTDDELIADGFDPNSRPHFGALSRSIETFFGDQIREPLRPESLARLSPLDSPPPGIYNHAVIMAAKRTKFSQSLLKDLSRIQERSDEDLDATALRHVFRQQESSTETKKSSSVYASSTSLTKEDAAGIVVDNIPLNAEQRDAVASLLVEDVTVVTGPPGTGKSQVAISAIANARLKGQKVLFSSRNHKAIDSVVSRPEMVTSEDIPLIVRANSKSGDADFDFGKAIDELLTSPHDSGALEIASTKKEKTFEHLQKRGELTRKAGLVVELRDRISRIQERQSQLISGWSEDDVSALENNARAFPSNEVSRLQQSLERLPDLDIPLNLWRRLLLWYFSREARRVARRLFSVLSKKIPQWSQPAPGKGVDGLKRLKGQIERLQRAESFCQHHLEQEAFETKVHELEPVEKLSRKVESESTKILALGTEAISSDTASRVGFPPDSDRTGMANLRNALKHLSNPLLDEGMRKQTFEALENHLPSLLWHFPAWAVTNLAVASRIPLLPGIFDIAIIDEASQCDIPSAIPILFRAKRAGVVGDQFQLQHITKLSKSAELLLFHAHGIRSLSEQRFSYSSTSLFKLFAETNGVNPIWLLDHYRCAEGIAEYANQTFYGQRLRIITAADRLKIPRGRTPGIHWSELDSTIEPRPNGCASPDEAELVVNLLREILVDEKFEGTVGVVTPFQRQKQEIEALIYKDSELAHAGINASLIVDTAHGFQGDERDVMVMSLCAGPGMPDPSLRWLGTIANLLNVAATRARAVLHIVGNKTWAATCGLKHISALARSWKPKPLPTSAIEERFESPWERRLYYALIERGVKPIPQYPLLGRRLDFGLVEEGKQSVDIEVDGARYHLEPDGSRCRDDVWRDITVRGAGWKVMRFWVHDLRDNMDACLDQIEKEWTK